MIQLLSIGKNFGNKISNDFKTFAFSAQIIFFKVEAVLVAQLVERSLPTPKIRGLNPNFGKLYLSIVHLNRKDENKEKEAGKGPSKFFLKF